MDKKRKLTDDLDANVVDIQLNPNIKLFRTGSATYISNDRTKLNEIIQDNDFVEIPNMHVFENNTDTENNSHIILEITGHGITMGNINTNVDNVLMFSIAPEGAPIYSMPVLDDNNRAILKPEIQKGYNVYDTFEAFRAYMIHPDNEIKKAYKILANKYNNTILSNALNNNTYSRMHKITNDMMYGSDTDTPLIVNIYDIRYPHNEKQNEMLTSIKHSDGDFFKELSSNSIIETSTNTTDESLPPKYRLQLSRLLRYLQSPTFPCNFKYVTIYENSCRVLSKEEIYNLENDGVVNISEYSKTRDNDNRKKAIAIMSQSRRGGTRGKQNRSFFRIPKTRRRIRKLITGRDIVFNRVSGIRRTRKRRTHRRKHRNIKQISP